MHNLNHNNENEITIKEVQSRRELKKFVDFPNKLYKGNKYYVPQLVSAEMKTLSKNNPTLKLCDSKCWLAYNQKNQVVGRIAGIINHQYNNMTNKNYARFGWLDFIEDERVFNALFNTFEKWARENSAEYFHGPLGIIEFDPSGILIEGFNEIPTAYGKYNYPYYSEYLVKKGYQKDVDWIEYNVSIPTIIPEKYARIAKLIEKRYDLHCLKINSKKDLLKYTDAIFQLLNQEYQKIHNFSELTLRQIQDLKEQFIPLINPEFISIVLDNRDNVIAFGICLPSLSRAMQKSKGRLLPFGFIHIKNALRKNDTLDTLLIAVHQDYKNKGVNAIIFNQVGQGIIKNGITNLETTRQLEFNNKVLNLWNKFEYRQHKRSRCYIKKAINNDI